jgi:hypothetical protein
VIAALYVDPRGIYSGLPDVDCWGPDRDARLYAGPWPVVAHPPCERWGNFWSGGTCPGAPRRKLGDDAGCFAAALTAVRVWGGVLEHPARSRAWRAFGLTPPQSVGWTAADLAGGWTCQVEQGHYGHRAPKATWLYACRVSSLPSLRWGPSSATHRVELMARRERAATPPEFRDLLLSIAASCRPAERLAS